MLKLRHRHDESGTDDGRHRGDGHLTDHAHRGDDVAVVGPGGEGDRGGWADPARRVDQPRTRSAARPLAESGTVADGTVVGPPVSPAPARHDHLVGERAAPVPPVVVERGDEDAPTRQSAGRAATTQDTVTQDVTAREGTTHEQTTRTVVTWGIGQLLALAVGIAMVILGSMALSRSGLDVNDLYAPHVEVGGLHHTPLLGLVEVVFGLVTIAAAAIPGTVRSLLVLLGVSALAAGIGVLVYLGTGLHERFGVHDANGWVSVAAGALLILAAMLPATRERRVRVRRRRR